MVYQDFCWNCDEVRNLKANGNCTECGSLVINSNNQKSGKLDSQTIKAPTKFTESTIKGLNSANDKQFWVHRIDGLQKDIILERSAMKNRSDFDRLRSDLSIRFTCSPRKSGFHYCDEGTVEIISAHNIRQVSDSVTAEASFIKTMKALNYPFLYFDKEFSNYSKCFNRNETEKHLGRPDFLLCKRGLGTYAVDVSERANIEKYKRKDEFCITISKKDFKEATRFSRTFCMPWWWAIKNVQGENEHTWYMLSLFDFEAFYQSIIDEPEQSEIYLHGEKGKEFMCIPLSKARVLSLSDGDKNLFIQE